MKHAISRTTAVVFALLVMATFLNRSYAAAAPSGLISGRVVAGDTPIAGATVSLYGTVFECVPDPCMGVSAAVAHAITDANGAFSIDVGKAGIEEPMVSPAMQPPGAGRNGPATIFARPMAGSLYLIASGGDVGNGPNPSIKLMLALGQIADHVTINELTTVISAFTLGRRFLDQSGETLPPGPFGLARAFVDVATGQPRPILREGRNRPALVDTLADIISACVTSAAPAFPGCGKLFASITPLAAPSRAKPVTPRDTLAALRAILANPAANVPAVFAMMPPNPPYQPVLAAAPGAWLFTVNFAGGFSRPTAIAAEPGSHALWIANSGDNRLVGLDTDPASFGARRCAKDGLALPGMSRPAAMIVIPGDAGQVPDVVPTAPTLWVANRGSDSVDVVNLETCAARQLTGNGLSAPAAIATSPNNLVYASVNGRMTRDQVVAVMNAGADRVSFFMLDGSACGKPLENLGLKNPAAATICPLTTQADTCVANSGADEILMLRSPDVRCENAALVGRLSGAGLKGPARIIYNLHDAMLWATNRAGDSVSAFDGSGRPLPGSPFKGGGLREPEGIAFDGAGNLWIANHARGANSVTELNGRIRPQVRGLLELGAPLSPAGGFTGTGLDRPVGIAIDQLGDVWVTNPGDNSVTAFIGATIPPWQG